MTKATQRTALAAAAQASDALAELIRYAREGANHPSPFGQVEVIELLADATKMAIEIAWKEGDDDEERQQLAAALARYLEGWA